MSPSNSVIRRYTPPTCTLEIFAPQSALSRWVGRAATTRSQFELRLDDPRLPPELRISMKGDRDQLAALYQAVTSYVQHLLKSSPTQALFPEAITTADTTVAGTPANTLIESSDAAHPSPTAVNANPPTSTSPQIYLQPSKYLSHTLFLGPLATPATGASVNLSLLQLFDLATALDECMTDMVTIPDRSRSRFASATPPAWATIAAVLVAVVGVSTVLLQLSHRQASRQQLATTSTQNSLNAPQPQVSAQPSIPPITSLETLPPPQPPTGSTIVPAPNSSLPPPLTVPSGASPAVIPPIATKKTPSTTPISPVPSKTTPPSNAVQPNSKGQATIVIPKQAPAKLPTAAPQPTVSLPPSVAVIPNTPNRDLRAALRATNPNITPPAQTTTQSTPQSQSSSQQSSPNTVAAANRSQRTAFDSIPQVAEAREYFQQRWEPSSGVRQTLEYSLLLDVDGTIQRIEPLGDAASRYVDRTGMPLLGERFVSPTTNGRAARIRVVLFPNGKVQTFLEPN